MHGRDRNRPLFRRTRSRAGAIWGWPGWRRANTDCPAWSSRAARGAWPSSKRLMLDARHKLYLIRRDDTEHLIVLGPQGAATIESGIQDAAAHKHAATGDPFVNGPQPRFFCAGSRRGAADPARGLGRAGGGRRGGQSASTSICRGGGMFTERVMQIVALITILSIAPSILIMMTSFVRIVVVLSLAAHGARHPAKPAQFGDREPGAVPDLLRDDADADGRLQRRASRRSIKQPDHDRAGDRARRRADEGVHAGPCARRRSEALRRHEPCQEAGDARGRVASPRWRRPSCCPSSSAPSRSAF